MLYMESELSYVSVPSWVNTLIKFGYHWDNAKDISGKRKIGIVTTPCESTSASFIALGLLRKYLEVESANDCDFQFRLLQEASESFSNKTSANAEDGCVHDHLGKKWLFSCEQDIPWTITVYDALYKAKVKRKGKYIDNPGGPCKCFIHKGNASQWRLPWQHVIHTNDDKHSLQRSIYQDLFPYFGNEILESNLARSYSGLLMVGDGLSANTAYMKKLRSIAFNHNGVWLSLPDLLTIEQTKNSVARMKFETTQRLNDMASDHITVVADGARAFMASVSKFKKSDVIGIISRDEPEDNLESVNELLATMKRYYTATEPKFIISLKALSTMTLQAR